MQQINNILILSEMSKIIDQSHVGYNSTHNSVNAIRKLSFIEYLIGLKTVNFSINVNWADALVTENALAYTQIEASPATTIFGDKDES